MRNPALTLLFGMPRSGTTWIGKTFDSHPEVSYRHEPDSQFRLDDIMPLYPDPADAADYRQGVRAYCEEVLPRCTVRTCGKLPLFRKAGQSWLQWQGLRLRVFSARLLERLLGRRLVWKAAPGGRLVWKSIESLGRLGTLLRVIPDSRAVLIVRDPCGYVASVLRGEQAGRFGAADSIAEDYNLFALLLQTEYARAIGLELKAIRAASPVQRLAWLWVLNNEKACRDIQGLPQAAILRYEDLCRVPREGFRRLFDFCGLAWSPQTERFIAASTEAGHQAAYYAVVKDPLRAANRWREELDEGQIEAIRSLVRQHPVGRAYYGLDEQAAYPFLELEPGQQTHRNGT
ncbi:sulfotransferase [Thiohalobacter sp. IOR34]|uniref:sulfotransferase family protein n=1 Tax=Thiohalobacter sp. IOR34 TaxID=3057176 RepID=UPI0025B2036F|nr:sulfotransferase [Thiohalobacter sp. IOR34]WJW75345.1 sulfotransferase [Thiohalobacter sp. IOR34]